MGGVKEVGAVVNLLIRVLELRAERHDRWVRWWDLWSGLWEVFLNDACFGRVFTSCWQLVKLFQRWAAVGSGG